MLKQESMVVIADNTQAKKAKIIRIIKGSTARTATVGDRVVVTIKETSPTSSIKKGQVVPAVIVRVRKEIGRPDGTYVRFGDNAVVLLTKDAKGNMNPIGKRVFGPVARELRDIGWRNITNMAEEVV
ncbi:MAG: 50S ribosomal protein L14 [Candidatus Absconditabacteria bacterium]|nr:50S ribosomal protein L14 [Candidatus Absconditabacteria bacterium]MDD3868413.1 50S ribosomal protein L14 [Candidatus Absconditabacteria bacterium]MDD4714063.1 50S ribosomal protein L14 [Candidatus Absconditabacteria bacterium]